MLIEKLVIEGFLSYRKKQEIDLSTVSTCLILGRINDDPDLSNGAGKSSLFEAIPVNFFGKGSGRADLLDSYINDHMSKMYIEVIFKIDNQRFKSVRSKTRNTAAVFEVFLDTTNKKLKDATWKKTDKSIEDILGLSAKTYSSTIYLNERESLQVITGTSSERKEILRELLNIDIYEKASKVCNKRHDEHDRKVQVNINLIGDKQQQLEQEEPTKKQLNGVEADLRTIKRKLKSKEKELRELNDEKQKISTKIETEKLIKEQILQNKKILSELENKFEMIEKDLVALKEELIQQIESYEKFKTDVENDTKRKPEIEKQIKTQEKVLEKLDEFEKEHKKLLQIIKENVGKKTAIEKDIVATHTSIKPIKDFLQRLKQFGNVCPVTELTCSVLKGEYKQTLLDEKEKELINNNNKLHSLSEQLVVFEEKIKEVSTQVEKIEMRLDTRQDENDLLTRIKLDLQKIIHQEELFLSKEKEFNIYVKETHEERTDQKNERAVIKEKIEEQQTMIRALENKIDNELPKLLELAENNVKSCEKDISLIRVEHDKINQDVGELKNQIEAFERMKSDIKHLIKSNEENSRQKKIYQMLSTLLGKDGIQKSIMKESVPLLEQYTMEFLRIFNEDSDEIKIKFDLDPKRKDGEFKKGGGLDILVLEEGRDPKDLQMYSGGETVRIVFSIVLSLAKLLSLRAGKRHEALIVDEKIAKLDSRGIELFGQVIGEISKIYKQVFVITHLESLKDLINGNEIIVNKTSQGSLVTIQ